MEQTPKEKAEKLVERYAIWSWNEVVCDYQVAKQCALIAVDEMLGNVGMIWGCNQARDEFRDYWQEVKQEIEKR